MSALLKLLDKVHRLPVDTRAPTAREILREVFLNDFELFAKYALGFKDINRRTHGEAIACLESAGDRKIIVLPRGKFKSTLCDVAYPMWRL